MEHKAFKIQGTKYPFVLLIAIIGLIFNSCKKQEYDIPVNTAAIRFSSSAYTLERNSPAPLTVTLPLSLPVERDGSAIVTIDNSSTGLSSQYTISPDVPAAGLKLDLTAGMTQVTFNITSQENFEGDITVVLKLSSATGGVSVSSTNASATVTIKGKPIILPAITTSVSTLDNYGNVNVGSASPSKSFTVSGVKLAANITVTAPDNFTVSLDNTTFAKTASVPFAAANAGAVPVYVKFAPNSGKNQTLSGTVTLTSGTLSGAVMVTGNEVGNAAPGILIMKEDFEYGSATGDLMDLSGKAWNSFSGSVNPVQYYATGLNYPGYIGSGVGGGVISENGKGSRQDLARTFTTQTSGTIYLAQLVNITVAGTGDFFSSMRDSKAAYFNRLYVKDDGGKPAIGVAKSSATVAYSPKALSYGTTYLVVTKYDFATGVSSIYILTGAIPAIEPATADNTTDTGSGPASLVDIIIRQNTTDLTTSFDGIRIGTSWKQAVGLGQ